MPHYRGNIYCQKLELNTNQSINQSFIYHFTCKNHLPLFNWKKCIQFIIFVEDSKIKIYFAVTCKKKQLTQPIYIILVCCNNLDISVLQ